MKTNFVKAVRVGRATMLVAALAVLLATLGLPAVARPAHAETFTVTNTADPGNGICNASGCTLREAIEEANGTGSKDAIFTSHRGGVKTIKPKSQLPQSRGRLP